MKSLIGLSVKNVDGRLFLYPSKRKNPKIKEGEYLFVESLLPSSEFSVLRTSHPNKFYLNKVFFKEVIGVTYEEYRLDVIEKVKLMCVALKEIKNEDLSEQDEVDYET